MHRKNRDDARRFALFVFIESCVLVARLNRRGDSY